MKKIYCAECGQELRKIRKASKSQHQVLDMVEPHTCEDGQAKRFKIVRLPTPINPKTFKIDKELISKGSDIDPRDPRNVPIGDFSLVKILDDLDKKLEVETSINPSMMEDKRSKDSLRNELPTSNAPENLLGSLGISNTPKQKPKTILPGEPLGD